MGRKIFFKVAKDVRESLDNIIKRGFDWRQRERAQTLTRLDDGLSMSEVAKEAEIHVRTVGSTRIEWLKNGFFSLCDAARCGAPRKIPPDQAVNIVTAAKAEPLSARALLAKHVDNGGKPVHLNTIRAVLKRSDMVWKRTRASLKPKRDEDAFRAAVPVIKDLRKQAADGEIVLAYLDEAGFSQVHPNRSAWTPKAGRHQIEATRGKRLNVLAALMSTGELLGAKLWQSTTADAFVGFVNSLKKAVDKPLTIILDNASIHRAKAIAPAINLLETQGVSFYFLPKYSPELNRIEGLWHKIKYTWMAVKCRNSKELEVDIEEIFSNFGRKYQYAF